MYKKVTSLVAGIEKTIKQTAETQKVSEDLKRLEKEKSNYKLADDVVTIFEKFNNNEEYLELMHELTKDTQNVEKARIIRMLNDISVDIANSSYMVAKENCMLMHKEFLQSLELEFEGSLLSTNGLEIKKLRTQVGVFEMLHRLENAIKIYVNFFCNEVKVKPISPGETDPQVYTEYLTAFHKDILMRLKREFNLTEGRMRSDFPHRLRFASSLLSTFFSETYKAFILDWLETEEKSKETFLTVLHLTVNEFKTFKTDVSVLISELKIGNETTAENILEEIFLPFRKMYLQKEQSVMSKSVGSVLEAKAKPIQKIKMKDVNFEIERNFFDKINPIAKHGSDATEKDNFFKLTMS